MQGGRRERERGEISMGPCRAFLMANHVPAGVCSPGASRATAVVTTDRKLALPRSDPPRLRLKTATSPSAAPMQQ